MNAETHAGMLLFRSDFCSDQDNTRKTFPDFASFYNVSSSACEKHLLSTFGREKCLYWHIQSLCCFQMPFKHLSLQNECSAHFTLKAKFRNSPEDQIHSFQRFPGMQVFACKDQSHLPCLSTSGIIMYTSKQFASSVASMEESAGFINHPCF